MVSRIRGVRVIPERPQTADLARAADVAGIAQRVEVLEAGVVNVQSYGATGDGVTDDTVAVLAAAAAAAASVRTNTSTSSDGRGLVTAGLFFPAGSYLITEPDAILAMAAAASRGLVIEGAGRETTQIIFAPTVAAYLLDNASPGWQHITVRDISFVMENANASFMRTISAEGQRDYTFERVNWWGGNAANNGFRDSGADNYDTLSFWHCAVYGTWGTFFWAEGSDNVVDIGFHDQTWEVQAGNFIRMDKGGNVGIYGGSLVQVGAGTLFDLNGTTHSDGTCRFLVDGTRIELRAATSELIDCEWATGTITFQSVDNGAFASNATVNTQVNASFGSTAAASVSMPIITWDGCTLQGRHEYRYNNGSYALKQIPVYRGCEIRNYAAAADFVVATDLGAGLIGGTAVARFENCRGSGAAVFDTDVNWQRASRGETTRKVVSVRYAYNTNPFDGAYEEVVLPKNAVVTGARLYAPASGWAGTDTTTWRIAFETTEGAPTVLLEAATGANISSGFNVAAPDTLFHVCDTEAKRTIRLVSNATTQGYSTGFIGVLEYIG